ncbi:hypothetical protein [Nitrospira sp. BLG_1]|uniref:hypothetical protein n=1 Tax=Nitrospira sp. BLG_1 TaxID=3395883 RepID=UPI0039BCF9B2
MAVASLSMSLTDFRNHACAELFAGGTVEYDDLDDGEKADIDRYILRGERTFWLHPPGVGPYVWSCLRDPGVMTLWADLDTDSGITVNTSSTTVTASEAAFYDSMVGKTITINSVDYTVSSVTSSTVLVLTSTAGTQSNKTFAISSEGSFRLPDDFESPDSSRLRFTDSSSYPDIQLINETEVTTMRAQDSGTGYPKLACVRWMTSDGSAAQAQELLVWPDLDADYEVAMPFAAQPQGMSEANPYPRGGPEMADCLLSVILAICEEAKNGQRGDRWIEATEKCVAAAQRDRTRHHNFVAGRMRQDAGTYSYPFNVKNLIQQA